MRAKEMPRNDLPRNDHSRTEQARRGQSTGGKRADSPGDAARALFAKGEYKRAAYALLPGARRGDLNPEDLRLLADCYLRLDNPTEALTWLDAQPEKSPANLTLAGQCLLAQQRWKDADARFAAALKAGGSGEAALGRADAFRRGRKIDDLTPAERARLVDLLTTATTQPDCPWRAYSRLADLHDRAGDDPTATAEVLRRAVAAHPDLPDPRLRLARLLLDRLGDPAGAHEALRPIAMGENPDAACLWLALRAVRSTADARLGLAYVERLRPFFAEPGVGPDKIAGDIHLALGEPKEALARYEAEIRRDDSTAQLVGLFSRTEALLEVGSPDELVATARLAFGRWYLAWSDGVDFTWLVPNGGAILLADAEPLHYPFADTFLRVARRLAADRLPEPEIVAQANCLLYYAQGCPETPEGADWLRAAAALDHPRLDEPLARASLAAGELVAAIVHLLRFAVWLADRPDGAAAIMAAYARFAESGGDRLLALQSGEGRLATHRAILARLDAERDPAIVRRVYFPFYQAYWRRLFANGGMPDEKLRLIERLLAAGRDSVELRLDLAETLASLSYLDSAERAFGDVLRLDPANVAAHRGLSTIHEKRGSLREAIRHSAEVIRRETSPEQATRHEDLRARLSAEEQVDPDHEDMLKSAPYRWRLLTSPERTLLGTLNSVSGFRDFAHLARLAGLKEEGVPGWWQRLVDLGMVSWSAGRRAFEVNEHVRPLVVAEHPGRVLSRVIASGTESAVKCLFNSSLEADTYRALLEVFPNHLVLPDVALTAIFDFQQMQALLPPAEFEYFRVARADFVVVSTTTYVPFLAIETDSHYHDEPFEVERDRSKDAIFQLGGLPLLRFRPVATHDAAAIRDQLQEVVRALRDELRNQLARDGFRNARASLRQLGPGA